MNNTANENDRPSSIGCSQSGGHATPRFSYAEAFSRNEGLVSREEQQTLRNSRVAIPGMGGVGGIHLVTLARLGIGGFAIADGDAFEIGNFNRQHGATLRSVGKSKADVMAAEALAINPQAEMRVWKENITAENVDDFLTDVDVLVDSVDFFAFDTRRLLYRRARERGVWVITAGPIGFSTAWIVFDPQGMSFEEYFDLHEGMPAVDQFAAFFTGLTPCGTHFRYFDLRRVDAKAARGPSVGFACQLCSGVVGAEVLKILLKREPLTPAPSYAQFDAYRRVLKKGKLRWGNRGPLQRWKRRELAKQMVKLGYAESR